MRLHHHTSHAFWSKPPTLPENIFHLSLSSYPDRRDADPNGNVLVYSPSHGWLVISFEEVEEAIRENNCTHWTYTPPIPPNAQHHLRREDGDQQQR